MDNYIKPNWPAPKNVKAFTTKRLGGNFNPHIGNNPNDALANRKKLYRELNLPAEPFWLKQKHTNAVIHLKSNTPIIEPIADAAFATTPNLVCVVTTADCVPILVCNQDGTIVAAIHAGWKGIAAGIIEATIKAMNTHSTKLLAWLGPAIGANSFETGEDVREIFIKKNPENRKAFVAHNDHFITNIYLLASQCLNSTGITAIYGGKYCTFRQKELFFSFRRDGASSGRMASLIWLTA
jgi:YfiH family protein